MKRKKNKDVVMTKETVLRGGIASLTPEINALENDFDLSYSGVRTPPLRPMEFKSSTSTFIPINTTGMVGFGDVDKCDLTEETIKKLAKEVVENIEGANLRLREEILKEVVDSIDRCETITDLHKTVDNLRKEYNRLKKINEKG